MSFKRVFFATLILGSTLSPSEAYSQAQSGELAQTGDPQSIKLTKPNPLKNSKPESTKASIETTASDIRGRLSNLVISELTGYVDERNKLVERTIVPGGVTDLRVIEAIRNTPRHTFVPDALKDQSYFDRALPIGESQTISSPYIVAVMTEALQTLPTDSVLEIGTGSGYQAAVLSPLVQDVYTIEIVESIGLDTRNFLEKLGYENIHTKIGDGFQGWVEHAPFQKIIVTCSPSEVPKPLIDQLQEGGLMVIPVGTSYQQLLHVFRKLDGKLVSESIRPTLFVPMTGQAESERREARSNRPQLVNGDFEDKAADGKFIPGWYYEFNAKLVQDDKSPFGPNVVEFRSDDPDEPSMLIQGFRLDGRTTRRAKLRGAVRSENLVRGPDPTQAPMIQLRLLDENREVMGVYWLGFYSGTHKWIVDEQTFPIPEKCREAILQIGLFGATGMIRFDGLSVESSR